MPRSVYVVKGEGVRDSVWTPKTGLSTLSITDLPELVQTVPSPNCSVNPVVQVFIRTPAPAAHLAESASALCVPNNAVTTPNVAPLRLSSSPVLGTANKQTSAPNLQVRHGTVLFGNSHATSHVHGVMNISSNTASAHNIETSVMSQQTGRAGNSAHPPFRVYNRSPMVSTVLMKQMKPVRTRRGASASQMDSVALTGGLNRSRDANIELQGQKRKNTSTDRPGAGSTAQLSPPSGMKSTSIASKRDPPRSPSSPAKPARVPARLSPIDEIYSKEKRRVMGDMVERRIAHHREKSSEKSLARSLTPISRLIEDAAIHKLSRKSRETVVASGSQSGNDSIKEPMAKGLSKQMDASSTPVEDTEARVPSQRDRTGSEIIGMDTSGPSKDNIGALSTDRALARALRKDKPNEGSRSEGNAKYGSNPFRNSSSTKIGLSDETHLSVGRAGNIRVEAPMVPSEEADKVVRPPRFADDVQRLGSAEKTLVNRSSAPALTHSVEKGLQRAQEERMGLREVEDQYLTLTRSIFALIIQAGQEGRNREGFSGTELKAHMKKRVLAAFVTHTGERPSVLNQKALKLLRQFKLCTTDVATLSRMKDAKVRKASYPVRRSKKGDVRREDIRGLKPMLLSWGGFRGDQKANIDQFHVDALHLKCIAEALQDGTHVSLSNDEAVLRFKELVLVHSGMELICCMIKKLKTLYEAGDRECVRPWFRSTECILTWYNYMRSRMEDLLTIADEPFSSELRKYCKEFAKGLIDRPDDPNLRPELGEGVQIGFKLRELKKLIISLGEDENGNKLPTEDEYCDRTTSHLTPVIKLFARLLRSMALSAPSRSTGEGKGEGTGRSSREGSPESKVIRRDSIEARKRDSTAARQIESRAKRGEPKGSSNKGIESKRALKNSGANQEDYRARAVSNTRSSADSIRKRGVVDERRALHERGRGNGGTVTELNSFPSIPRRPANVDSGGSSTRAGAARSSGADASGGRGIDRSGPAATVQRLLVGAASPAVEKGRKRKRGESILQNHNNETLDKNGMRADRRKKSRIRFRRTPDVDEKQPPVDKESLRTLFSDGESWMLSGNAVQKAAIEERNARLSRETVDIWFSFVRTFVWKHKCMKDGRPFVTPRFLPNPSTPSAIRDLSRRVAELPASPRLSSHAARRDDVSTRKKNTE